MSQNNLLTGVAEGFEPFIIQQWWQRKNRHIVYITPTEKKANLAYEQLKFLLPEVRVYLFPAWDCLPYDQVSPAHAIMTQRLITLNTLLLCPEDPCIVVLSLSAFLQKLPPPQTLKHQSLRLAVGDKLNKESFISCLREKGYSPCDTVQNIGEFVERGDIIDLFPIGHETPLRIDLFQGTLEKLRPFNPATQTTIGTMQEFYLTSVNEVLLTPSLISNFCTRYRDLFGESISPLYKAISEGRRYEGMEHWLPLFFEKLSTLLDYIPRPDILVDSYAAVHLRLEEIQGYYDACRRRMRQEKSPPYQPLPPDSLYLTAPQWEIYVQDENTYRTTPNSHPQGIDFGCKRIPDLAVTPHTMPQDLETLIRIHPDKQIILTTMTDESRDRLSYLLQKDTSNIFEVHKTWPLEPTKRAILTFPMEKGFQTPQFLIITEQDIFGAKLHYSQETKKRNQFFLEIPHLSLGDLVVHRDHGIGCYQGLQAIETNHAFHDCLCLTYEGEDKLFVPVENIDVITRYGNDHSTTQLDKLGSPAWQNRKTRVKKSLYGIADSLIKAAAERDLDEGPILYNNSRNYDPFCAQFPYSETQDQLRAIEDTLHDMASGKPMDRLICGDVGFGKTEVALRAAFVAAAAGKQVALLTPTTLLCRQHFKTFKERFEGFSFRIEQLSRFVHPHEASQIRNDLKGGKVDILIATHTLFSHKVDFYDLGLLIIDEEQHFGVQQKEKLKSLKKNVHILTLTATPIPRTLQLALAGVRKMSLMTTPPRDRQAVRTCVIPYNTSTLQEVILREFHRGGQIFYVCPRLDDLPKLEQDLKTLVPDIKIAIANGQMKTPHLEEVITGFYDRQYHLLLSTNIVESGIDITNANTLIIHRADLFGLAQLYQLRGRVGRSNVQGYAYLTVPDSSFLSAKAKKRLEVMQTLDRLGAGFALATHDMDIRGTGNLIGEEQSGHICEVGVELYQSLLQEAILLHRAKQENTLFDEEWTPQIHLGTCVMIPETYIHSLDLRFNLYRRMAHLKTRTEIDVLATEMIDRFGKLPQEVINLLEIIEIRLLCRRAHIEKLEGGPRGLVMTFRNNIFPHLENLITYLNTPQTAAKLRSDHKVFFAREWSCVETRVKNTKKICCNLAKLAKGNKVILKKPTPYNTRLEKFNEQKTLFN